TGIVIHTNLGRSLLSQDARQSVAEISSTYSNLEYNINQGERGSRYNLIEDLITKITGAEAALVVNNNAAAVMLVLNTLCQDKEAIVSRGELVEIGGSFRVPEVMKLSGAKLKEIGTTNRTHLSDYQDAISEETGIILKVHTSNYKVIGFTKEVTNKELSLLSKKIDIPLVEDIGSGIFIDFTEYGLPKETTVQESIKFGSDVVTFSGDKILGGPQAGIIVGKKQYIDKMKKNQLLRALRVDKMTIAALSATLEHYIKEEYFKIPTLKMILTSFEEEKKRALKLKRILRKSNSYCSYKVDEDYSKIGGGSMPLLNIKSAVLKITCPKYSANELEKILRENYTPIISRINKDELILDIRTIQDEDFDEIKNAFSKIIQVEKV
ncbi:MAG: L-seryl-tRNA(Sec) selenium transferase, partial [Clostridiaceae bacterium]